MRKVFGLIRLIRPINCFMMGLAVLIGEAITYNVLFFLPSLCGFVTAFMLTGASMVTNDYWDRHADAVNAPNRPIVSGLISPRLALTYALFLISCGLGSALYLSVLLLNPAALGLALFSLLVSLFYSYKGKQLGLLGNLMVSGCLAIPLFYGGLLSERVTLGLKGFQLLLIFDLMIVLANTGREVNKGIADTEGDRLRGVQTVAIQFGAQAAATIAAIFYLVAVGCSGLPWVFALISVWYLPLVAVADLGFVASSFILLRDHSKESALKVKRMVLIWMGVGLVAFVAGGF